MVKPLLLGRPRPFPATALSARLLRYPVRERTEPAGRCAGKRTVVRRRRSTDNLAFASRARVRPVTHRIRQLADGGSSRHQALPAAIDFST